MDIGLSLKIIRRWWWLVLLPTLAAAGFALATRPAPQLAYAATMRFTAAQPAATAQTRDFDPNYYRWLTSEYIANGLADWASTRSFAEAVAGQLEADGVAISAADVQASVVADNARSVLVLYVSYPTPEGVRALANAISSVLQTRAVHAFPQLGQDALAVVPLDPPDEAPITPVPPSLRSRFDLPLKVGLGLALGVVLAFLAHWVDPFVRERADLEAMGYSVVGEIRRR